MAQQPLLALQVKPVQTPTYGDIMQEQDAYRAQQNALAQQQMKQQQNAMLNQAYRAAYDPQTGRVDQAKLYGRLAEGGMGAEIPGQMEALGKGRKESGEGAMKQLEYGMAVVDAMHSALANSRDRASAQANGARLAQAYPELAEQLSQELASVPSDPAQFAQWREGQLRSTLEAKDQLKQHFQTQNLGGSTRVLAMPEYGGGGAAVVPGSEAEVTMSPAQANPAGRVVQDADGSYYLVNTRTAGAAPVTVGGGGIPTGRGGGFDTEAFKAAVVQQESGGDYTVVSPKGALGAYQVMPATAKTLAERLGLPWNPGLMRSNTAEGRQYQDAIGAAAISEAVQAAGGDPVRAAAYYHGGSDTGKWGPKTQAYAQAVTANMSRSDGGQLRGVPKGGKAAAASAPAGKLTQAEQTASYNINRVLQAAAEIRRVTAKNPTANAPGAVEAFVSGTPLLNRGANFTRSADRQIVAAAQRDMLDGLLYLATGAAYNKEQLEGQMESYIPAYSDEPDTVKSKRDRLANLVAAAKTRAGNAWSPQMDASLRALTGATAPAPTGGAPKRLKYNPATGGFD
jgi:hypothetical protein